MKILKGLSFLQKNKQVGNRQIQPFSKYNPENSTLEEFREYVSYLAKNNINRTFVEPAKFVTETKKQDLQQFKKRVQYLAENNINHTFIC